MVVVFETDRRAVLFHWTWLICVIYQLPQLFRAEIYEIATLSVDLVNLSKLFIFIYLKECNRTFPTALVDMNNSR
jgi:hypothetical protein